MPLFEKKQQLSRGEIKGRPEKVPPPKEEKKDLSIFGGKSFIRGGGLRNWARSDQSFRTTNLPQSERLKITQELFGKKDFLKKKDVETTLKRLEMARFRARKDAEIKEIKTKIKIAKSILGK